MGTGAASISMEPSHEWKILYVTFRAYGNESTRNQIGPPPLREGFAIQAWPAGTFHSAAVERKFLHGAPTRAVVPTGKTDEGNELVGVLDSLARLPVFWRKPEVGSVETCLKALFAYQPVGRAFVLGERPFVQPGSHERFVTPKVYEGPNAERTDELSSPDRSEIRHGCGAFLFRDGFLRSSSKVCFFAVAARQWTGRTIDVYIPHGTRCREWPIVPERMTLGARRIH